MSWLWRRGVQARAMTPAWASGAARSSSSALPDDIYIADTRCAGKHLLGRRKGGACCITCCLAFFLPVFSPDFSRAMATVFRVALRHSSALLLLGLPPPTARIAQCRAAPRPRNPSTVDGYVSTGRQRATVNWPLHVFTWW